MVDYIMIEKAGDEHLYQPQTFQARTITEALKRAALMAHFDSTEVTVGAKIAAVETAPDSAGTAAPVPEQPAAEKAGE